MLRKIFFVVILGTILFIGNKVNNSPQKTSVVNTVNQATNTVREKTFDKGKYSTSDSSSLWVVVNKKQPLSPKDYTPANLVIPSIAGRVPGDASMKLRNDNAAAMAQMFAAAKADGLSLMLASGYRSYYDQQVIYNGYVKSMGQAATDTQSARAGYSEHQTGLAADLEPASRTCEVDPCFAKTKEGIWLAANAYKYGYIIRYPNGKDSVTGYEYEPWHVRYVGTELSNEMHATNVSTLEEFFGVTGGTSY